MRCLNTNPMHLTPILMRPPRWCSRRWTGATWIRWIRGATPRTFLLWQNRVCTGSMSFNQQVSRRRRRRWYRMLLQYFGNRGCLHFWKHFWNRIDSFNILYIHEYIFISFVFSHIWNRFEGWDSGTKWYMGPKGNTKRVYTLIDIK